MASARDQILQSAEKYLSRGKLDQALKEYLRLLEENPKDISTLNKVGDLYVRMNRPQESIQYYARIADFYSRDGFFLKAIAIYKKINKIDPSRLDVYDRLADLYHKQGLIQDARSQYQVVADHHQKNNRPLDAISVYKKMSAVDPGDLKIQVRLADLYRATNQTDQAVMQYGLIGSMLLRRGAHDEAAQVFQKALELSPNDAEIQKNLVRSLLAQKNAAAAIAILRAAPRTPESLTLFAEAQLETGDTSDAVKSLEQALALDARHERSRQLLCRVRLQEGAFDAALSAISPLFEAALSSREAGRAAAYLTPILEAEPAHRPTLEKLLDVREAEGNRSETARLGLALAREAEKRGDRDAAVLFYQRALRAEPEQAEALSRLRELAPDLGVPAAKPPSPTQAFEVQELVLDIEEPGAPATAPPAPARPAPVAPEPAPPPPPPVEAPPAEPEIETLVVEAEVFAKYGLTDKAIERLRSLVRRRPDLLPARERLVQLMADTKNPALSGEAQALARVLREAGRTEEADRVLERAGLPSVPAPEPPAALASPPVEFEEFNVEPHAAPPAPAPAPEFVEDFGSETIRLEEAEEIEPGMPTGRVPEPASPSASDSEFVSYEQLGSLIEEEMQKAGEEAPTGAPSGPLVNEENLFADEQEFFNLAEELERELADEPSVPQAPAMEGPQGEVSLEEIFREFKKGVEQQLSAEDYETHYNLGIAYKEMGLIDEAIGEFQLASKDSARMVECCSMLGLCFLEKGMPQLAIKWYRKGLEAPQLREAEHLGLLYDLACVYQDTGELDLAYRTFLEIYGLNTNYRDVVSRVKDLEAVRKS